MFAQRLWLLRLPSFSSAGQLRAPAPFPQGTTRWIAALAARRRLVSFASVAVTLLTLTLAGCGSAPPIPTEAPQATPTRSLPSSAQEVVLFSLSLIDTGYRFGGKNPSAGLDCSGMVSYIYAHAVDYRLTGSAADMARHGHAVAREALQPGDLLFFNTGSGPYSHVAIFIGEDRFIHAPSSSGNGRVRIDRLSNRYFAERFVSARRYLD
ncbi:C40 family peptidase [Rhodocyclus gracilis]|uniref:NlpC/P60 domain-containing protein n=1 Tax=Rhodocyclus tenuis TaxID=1066 RepID=A0A6L5JZS8_RHOTE|nr:C40 family peptidase [Rhodocyclus gracilis]MQY52591.1 hypothetical protein [Rhodocyclus gracilis]